MFGYLDWSYKVYLINDETECKDFFFPLFSLYLSNNHFSDN